MTQNMNPPVMEVVKPDLTTPEGKLKADLVIFAGQQIMMFFAALDFDAGMGLSAISYALSQALKEEAVDVTMETICKSIHATQKINRGATN